MEFRIADTFTASLARLTGDEQKAVKTTAFDLQLNPAHPSLQFHKLDKPRDPNFSSVRVSLDVRVIVHRTGSSLLLCYVGHHDDAYQWAQRRKLETHPKTGAAQLVEVRETVQEIVIPHYVEQERPAPPKPKLFNDLADDKLLGYGVPPEWLADVRAATEETLLDVADHLPAEAAEALLNIAVGVPPITPVPAPVGADPFEHPDAQRRFRLMTNVEELERALDYPWEKWTIFLHPAQRQLVERSYNGPARVSGSAGTGKTIVALHRAVHLARTNPESRVLLTTFSDSLAGALRPKLRALIANQPHLGERIDVYAIEAIGRRLYELNFGPPRLAGPSLIRDLLKSAKFSQRFLLTEWEQVVDAWQIETWEGYRDAVRLGRRTRLPENRRAELWSIFEKVRSALHEQGLITYAKLFTNLAAKYAGDPHPPFDFVVVDEAQDIEIAQLRFLAAMGGGRRNALFFAGDLGQRIFQQPFSWKGLGVDVRGRATNLRINYRTSHQIRRQADRLLGPELADVDGNAEQRKGTVSLFNGPPPKVSIFKTEAEEVQAVSQHLKALAKEGVLPHEIGVFVRSSAQLDRARAALNGAKIPFRLLDEKMETASRHAVVGTMHLAKGLEFRAVVAMACDDEVIPLQERIESVTDDSELEDVYNTERQLLYVACTRARDNLLVTSVAPASEFLDDLSEPRSKDSL
jgi:mRNA-degrading endonuclease RelE of RelBE toxin-antitoxin system